MPTALPEEQERIDIFQDLPIKNKNELDTMEAKLGTDILYRNEMVNILYITKFVLKMNNTIQCKNCKFLIKKVTFLIRHYV